MAKNGQTGVFVFRELTEEEHRFVADGGDPIIVVGKRESGDWIVVTGQRQIGGAFANFYGEMNGGSGSEQAVPAEPADCEITDIMSDYGQSVDQRTLAETVSLILDRLGIRPGDGAFSHRGSTIRVNELYGNLGKMDFQIMPDWWRPANGNYGEVIYDNGNPLAPIQGGDNGLAGYAAHRQTGMVFYVLHELVHATAAGDLRNRTTGDGNDEVWANDLARDIASEIGLALDPSFMPRLGGFSTTNATFQEGSGAPVETTSGCDS